MDAVTYPQEEVTRYILDHFVPVRIHTDDRPELTEKYHAPWTPTFLILGSDGTEYYRETGYLPPRELLAHLSLALGRAAFEQRNFAEASRHLATVVDRYGENELVPEALYFLGVSKNKVSGKADERRAVWKQIIDQYPKSDWAKKVSFAFE
ncbi:MAG: thioredoxin family protein [Deltaproteobacteria bacterium]|nr:thioredoxin family protein [Deltaproteobacteria bacterium]MCZ6547593.1 thioredoxin family protein [Deltaproteobacteria bacterium]MCZ6564483.1 thioredoxin family protein [Deltaproteobacteria bacterium]MCZ6621059.1 thioredoxin family protein [Deltaproteobacteria bacterium]